MMRVSQNAWIEAGIIKEFFMASIPWLKVSLMIPINGVRMSMKNQSRTKERSSHWPKR